MSASRPLSRHWAPPVGALFVLAIFAGSSLTGAAVGQSPQACRSLMLYAVQLPPSTEGSVRLAYGRTPTTASIPGPLIELTEGECLDITLHNDIPIETLRDLRKEYGGTNLPLAVSIHPHGVEYGRESDGTVTSDSYVLPGESRTFRWTADVGTAGYWWYHDHVVGTEHGTGGQGAGLFGGLIVRRAGDPEPEVSTFVVAMGDGSTINLERYPNTPTFTARLGQRVEFLVLAWGSEFHSFHLHAHRWADNRTGILDLDQDTRVVDNKVMGPGDSFGFQIIAGQDVGPNKWMYHCHVQVHSDSGMTGFFRVLPPE